MEVFVAGGGGSDDGGQNDIGLFHCPTLCFAVAENERRKASGDRKKFSISDLWGRSKKKGQAVISTLTRKTLGPDVEVDPSASMAGWCAYN